MDDLSDTPRDRLPNALREAASGWAVRRDRGLSAGEEVEFTRWLAADPRHARALAKAENAWKLLGRLPAPVAQSVLAAAPAPRPPARWFWPACGGLAAAAAIAVGILALPDSFRSRPANPESASVSGPARAPETRILPDGTVVRLNTGAEIAVDFTARERSVRLTHGEAFFTVTKDPARPLVVYANQVAVRAVGTAFNVNLQSRQVDVLVTEGVVQVSPRQSGPLPELARADRAPAVDAPWVVAGHRVVVQLQPPRPEVAPVVEVSAIDAAALSQALAWREPLLKRGGATLAELVAPLERQLGCRIVLANPTLATLRLGGRFPSDDPDGFLRVLEEHYRITSRRAADGSLVLDQAP